jgi:1,4-alpha-glucan branching enzyme
MVAEENRSLLSDDDVFWFNEGTHLRLFEKLGSHPGKLGGKDGVYFGVWAPNASAVSVIGDFNGWARGANALTARASSGIWEGFIEGMRPGEAYKYHIVSHLNGYRVDKADPFAFYAEQPPKTASKTWDLDYEWGDSAWLSKRKERQSLSSPVAIYELHLGSWRHVGDGDRPMTYREIAQPLAEYVKWLGYTHVEFLPLMEHPFYGSWGYQTTGYFAATSRYGTPQDLMYLIDYLHQEEIGVILDWVPSHFPADEHGLSYFDGTHLFEHADPQRGFHPDWGSLIFNYGRNEVRSFLLSSAYFWLDKYHADGLRVDAVASMLYLDYSRKAGEWQPNQYGGRENLEAIDFLRRFNTDMHGAFDGVLIVAEESTAWPMVSRPTYLGGLGFGLKWDMGWMHDTLQYMEREPVYRRHHHGELTFRMVYGYTENFVLPLSHDEVVHGKGSILTKMPGDEWQKFANLRLLYAYMTSQPGKKMLFMGSEFGQWREWAHEESLEWHLTAFDRHSGIQRLLRDLNTMYAAQPAMHEGDCESFGFQWLDANDADRSVVSMLRRARDPDDVVLAVANFTPVPRHNYRVGVPFPGLWRELVNTDAEVYGGSGQGNFGGVDAAPVPYQDQQWSVMLTVPPLGAVFLKSDRN